MGQTFNLANFTSVRPIVRKAARLIQRGTALDIGSGVGRHSIFIAEHGLSVTAVENRSEAVAALKEIARLRELRIAVRHEDALSYQPRGKFDVVLTLMVLHFMKPEDQQHLIDMAMHATKRRGIHVIANYSSANAVGERPYLLPVGHLRTLYENAGWEVLSYEHRKSVPPSPPDAAGYWIEEFIARKP